MPFSCDICPKFFDTQLMLEKHKNSRHNYILNNNLNPNIFLNNVITPNDTNSKLSSIKPNDSELSSGSLLVRVHQYEKNLLNNLNHSSSNESLLSNKQNDNKKISSKKIDGKVSLTTHPYEQINNSHDKLDKNSNEHLNGSKCSNVQNIDDNAQVLVKKTSNQYEKEDQRFRGIRKRLNMLDEILSQLYKEVFEGFDNKSTDYLSSVIKILNGPMAFDKNINPNITIANIEGPCHGLKRSCLKELFHVDNSENSKNRHKSNSDRNNETSSKIEGKLNTTTRFKHEGPLSANLQQDCGKSATDFSEYRDKDLNYSLLEKFNQRPSDKSVNPSEIDIDNSKATDWSTLCQMLKSITRQTILNELSQQTRSDLNQNNTCSIHRLSHYNTRNNLNNADRAANESDPDKKQIDPNTYHKSSIINFADNFDNLQHNFKPRASQCSLEADEVSLVRTDNNISDDNDSIINRDIHFIDSDSTQQSLSNKLKLVMNDEGKLKIDLEQGQRKSKNLEINESLNAGSELASSEHILDVDSVTNANIQNLNTTSVCETFGLKGKDFMKQGQELDESDFICPSTSLKDSRNVIPASDGSFVESTNRNSIVIQSNYDDNRKLNSRHDSVEQDHIRTSNISPTSLTTERATTLVKLRAQNKIVDDDHKESHSINEARYASGLNHREDGSLVLTDHCKDKPMASGLEATKLTNSIGYDDKHNNDVSVRVEATETNNKQSCFNSFLLDEKRKNSNEDLSGFKLYKSIEEHSKIQNFTLDSSNNLCCTTNKPEAASFANEILNTLDNVSSCDNNIEDKMTTIITREPTISTGSNGTSGKEDLATTLETEPIEGKDNDNLFWGSSEPLFSSSFSAGETRLTEGNLSDNHERQKQSTSNNNSSTKEKLVDLMTLPPANSNEISNSSELYGGKGNASDSNSSLTQLGNCKVSCEQQQQQQGYERQREKLDCLYEIGIERNVHEERDLLIVDGRGIVCCNNSIWLDKNDSSAIRNNINNNHETETKDSKIGKDSKQNVSRVAGEDEAEVKKVNCNNKSIDSELNRSSCSSSDYDKFHDGKGKHKVIVVSETNLSDSSENVRNATEANNGLVSISSDHSTRVGELSFNSSQTTILATSVAEVLPIEAPLNSPLASRSSLVAVVNDDRTSRRQRDLEKNSESFSNSGASSSIIESSQQRKLECKENKFDLEKLKKVSCGDDVTNIKEATNNILDCSQQKIDKANSREKSHIPESRLEIINGKEKIISNFRDQQSSMELSSNKNWSYIQTEGQQNELDTSTKSIYFPNNHSLVPPLTKSSSSPSGSDDNVDSNNTVRQNNDTKEKSQGGEATQLVLDERSTILAEVSCIGPEYNCDENNNEHLPVEPLMFSSQIVPDEKENASKIDPSSLSNENNNQTTSREFFLRTSIKVEEKEKKLNETIDQIGNNDKGLIEAERGASGGIDKIVDIKFDDGDVSGFVINREGANNDNNDKGTTVDTARGLKFIEKTFTSTPTSTITTAPATSSKVKSSNAIIASVDSEVMEEPLAPVTGRVLKLKNSNEKEKNKDASNNTTIIKIESFSKESTEQKDENSELKISGSTIRNKLSSSSSSLDGIDEGHIKKVEEFSNNSLAISGGPPSSGLLNESGGLNVSNIKTKKLKSILKRTIHGANEEGSEKRQQFFLSPQLNGSTSRTRANSGISNHSSESASGLRSISTIDTTQSTTSIALDSSSYFAHSPTALASPKSEEGSEKIATSSLKSNKQLTLGPGVVISLKGDAFNNNNNNKKKISDSMGLTMAKIATSFSSRARPASASKSQSHFLTNSKPNSLYSDDVGNKIKLDWHSINHSTTTGPTTQTVARRRSLVRFSDVESVLELSPRESSGSRSSSDDDNVFDNTQN